jgi:CHAD domain-containing protein
MRQDVAVGDALRAVARDTLAEARAALEDVNRPSAVAVHDYRKAMKRWRALLRLLAPFLGDLGDRLRVEARDLARELSGARDAQAGIEALEDIAEHNTTLSARTLATMRGRLEAMRQSTEALTLTEERRARCIAAITAAEAIIGHWPIEKLTFEDIATELAGMYRRMRQSVPDDWLGGPAEDLHEFRRRVVAHRYQMELAEPLWPRLGKIWVGEAQRLRDRLGAHQDLAVLQGFTAPHQPLAPWRSRLTPVIAERQVAHAKAAAKIAGRLLAEKPKAFRRRIVALWESGRD